MRSVLLHLHRYVGLVLAGFLIVAGLTGAIISWDREVDEWINRDLYTVKTSGPYLSPHALAAIIEAREPRGRVTFLPLHLEPGKNDSFTVRPRTDPATGEPYALDYTHIFVDPVTGAELGRRDGDGTTLDWRSLMPFMVRLHHSLHLPVLADGTEIGVWLLGLLALTWFLHSLVAIVLTFPLKKRARPGSAANGPPPRSWWSRWKPSWKIRRGVRGALSFDLHRAGALWLWPALLTVAFTGFTQSLFAQVFQPAISFLSETSPSPYDGRPPVADPDAVPVVGSAEVAERARSEAKTLGWSEPAHAMSYSPEADLYAVFFLHAEDDRGGADISMRTLYFGGDGKRAGLRTPLSGSAADIIEKMQFPVHSGRLFGLPGQIFMSFFGVAVATLATTGIIIWARKRRNARRGRKAPARIVNGYAR